jgi:hypothetical protein
MSAISASAKLSTFSCELCDYTTSRKYNYDKHVRTGKHTNQVATSTVNSKSSKSSDPTCVYICECCKKTYASRVGLWKHNQKCSIDLIKPPPHIQQLDNESIISLLKQNQEFKELLLEQHNKIVELSNKTTITNNTNCNNKFNLHFFLNNTCKDAVNLSDFIQTIEVQMQELESIGHNGYVAGMTDIILSRIKNLDVYKRPMHCTDLKRETMYVKDCNEWNKETADKSYLRKAISMVAKKNYGKTMEWRECNPECLEFGSPKYDFCFKMMRNILGDFEDIQIKLDNKIIKNLAKEVLVDR